MKKNQEPILMDLYAALAMNAVMTQYGPQSNPAFIASKAFEMASEMIAKREEILKGEKSGRDRARPTQGD
jgi:hypothetical protein